MNHVHLISETNSLMLRGLIYPQKDETTLGQASAVSQAGVVYISRKAAPSLFLVRSFAGVSDSEFNNLREWYLHEAEGARNTFTFIDGDGLAYIVRWMNGPADWQRDIANRWSGTMRLCVENYEP
jgi:hypothetical protein